MANTPDSNSMWGGRFGGGPAAIMPEINASIPVDKRLWEEDIAASRAHAAMLGATGIIAAEDAVVIDRGLAQIADEFARDGVPVDLSLEDIHMTVEARLKELVGEPAGRLHTARSRNDQVATDFRLWTRTACERIDAGLQAIHAAVTPDVLAALTVEASVASRMSYGGTAPERVRQAVAAARAALEGTD